MSAAATRSDAVARMLAPRSIAVVGASARPLSFGARMTQEVLRSPAELAVHLVNPGYDEVAGRPCLPSLADVPVPVDLVLLGIGDDRLETELTTAAKRGDGAAVIFGNAYAPSEPGLPTLRERLATIASDAEMAVCGGGCMGFVNAAAGVRAIGYVEPDPTPRGPVAMVTHSGSVFSAVLRARRGLGFTVAVSSGQELVTTTASYLDYALSLPETGVVALVLEAIRDAPRLRAALDRAAERDIPVVVLPVGTSEQGQSMVAAHSGAVAGGTAAWEALADAHGLHLVGDLGELLDTVELFAAGRRARPRRPGINRTCGVGAVLDSGAERALLADLAAAVDVPFAELSEPTIGSLGARLDPGLVAGNPLDVWGRGADTEALFGDVLATMADDPAVQAVVLAVDLVYELDGDDSYPRAALRASAGTDAPVVVLSHFPAAIDLDAAAQLRAAGVPVLEGTRSGLKGLRHLLDDAEPRTRVQPQPTDGARRDRWREQLNGPMTAEAGFGLLSDYGVPVAEVVAAASEAAVVAAGTALGYPVVLKTDEGVAHKTDVGGVATGLRDAAALAASYRDMAQRLGPNVVVCREVPAGAELLVGAVRDPSLGMVLVVGAGGLMTEQIADRATALPPLDEDAAKRLLERSVAARLLRSVRGAPPADLDAVARVVAAFSRLVADLDAELYAVEINPLVCGTAGAVAVDVLVEPRQKIT